MKNKRLIAVIATGVILTFFHAWPTRIFADSSSHYTLFINQTRGSECCDAGQLDFFRQQLETFEEHQLTAHFALRYDVLTNKDYIAVTTQHPQQQYGLLLEIIPSLAAEAKVEYQGDETTWYQANHSMLVGYSLADRQKLIDKALEKFYDTFGHYPTFTTSWMIDPWSLQYLKKNYGVMTHQITREQFGTDTYTLYGGPPHYPYYPSANWALIPDSGNQTSPIIVRQTITDPVYNYGDRTNAYTSQPNDYGLRQAGLDYFSYIFNQAHQQPNEYTFALLGLENSMEETYQTEYQRQIELVSDWAQAADNQVISVEALPAILGNQTQVYVYHGTDQNDSQAWWIRTDTYRARVRQSGDEVFLSDLRIYDSRFTDPYQYQQAEAAGWWIVPFVLDGSRFYDSEASGLETYNDFLTNRKPQQGVPEKIVLAEISTEDGQLTESPHQVKMVRENGNKSDAASLMIDGREVAKFLPTTIYLPTYLPKISDSSTDSSDDNLWPDLTYPGHDQPSHTWTASLQDNWLSFKIFNTDLESLREKYRADLFPEARYAKADAEHTILYINNKFAITGRNPARLVLFPQDDQGQPIKLDRLPTVTTDNADAQVVVYDADSKNGMVFIDIEANKPLQTAVTVQAGDTFTATENVYLAPNCKTAPKSCLNFVQAYRYLRSYLGDKLRHQNEARQKRLNQPQ